MTLSDGMVTAVLMDEVALADRLLDAGVDVVATNGRGKTAFSRSCAGEALGVVRLLHSRSADVNMVDGGRASPLDWAVCWSSHEFRAWLRSVGGVRHDDSYAEWPWPLDRWTGTP